MIHHGLLVNRYILASETGIRHQPRYPDVAYMRLWLHRFPWLIRITYMNFGFSN
jgi:hypothetical protein